MATLNNSNQIIYTGRGYLDAKMQPVNALEDLNKIPKSQRFLGLTVVVLTPEPCEYWLPKSLAKWEKKTATIDVDGNDLEEK